MVTKVKKVPFDRTEVTNALCGIDSNRKADEHGGFIESVEIRRRAFPEELPEDLNEEPKQSTSFSNLRKIDF